MVIKMEEQIEVPKMSMNMNFQSERLKTFKDWPFNDDCRCTAEMMAEAGFYHTPSINEPDLVTCYVCYKEMDGWEPTDDPWLEHKNHSSKCPFVIIGKKQNEWTVEEMIKMEIKRQEYGITKIVDSTVAYMQDQSQLVMDKLQNIMET